RQKPNESFFAASTRSYRSNGQIRHDAFGQSSSSAGRKIERGDSQLCGSANQTVLAGTGSHEGPSLRRAGGSQRQIWTSFYWKDLVGKVRQAGGIYCFSPGQTDRLGLYRFQRGRNQ